MLHGQAGHARQQHTASKPSRRPTPPRQGSKGGGEGAPEALNTAVRTKERMDTFSSASDMVRLLGKTALPPDAVQAVLQRVQQLPPSPSQLEDLVAAVDQAVHRWVLAQVGCTGSRVASIGRCGASPEHHQQAALGQAQAAAQALAALAVLAPHAHSPALQACLACALATLQQGQLQHTAPQRGSGDVPLVPPGPLPPGPLLALCQAMAGGSVSDASAWYTLGDLMEPSLRSGRQGLPAAPAAGGWTPAQLASVAHSFGSRPRPCHHVPLFRELAAAVLAPAWVGPHTGPGTGAAAAGGGRGCALDVLSLHDLAALMAGFGGGGHYDPRLWTACIDEACKQLGTEVCACVCVTV